MKIDNLQILTPQGKLEKVTLTIDGGTISGLSPVEQLSAGADLDTEGWIASPGWIDLQINGGFGHDFTTNPESLWDVATQLPKFGVTGFLPTIITSSADTFQKAIEVFRKGPPQGWRGARVFGWHFEGPFLNPGKNGAHDPASLVLPDMEFIENWSKENGVAMVTMAPELPGADEVASQLREQGVILSMGHSLATLEDARHAIEKGFTSATHLFNAMPALDHRKPGLACEVLLNPGVTTGIIADGQHVDQNMVNLAWKMKAPDKLALVSDAVGALGMPPGEFIQGGLEIVVSEDSAKLKNGTLAGSVLRLDRALRNVMAFTGSSIDQVLPALGVVQANLLGLQKNGRIESGFNADLTVVDNAGNLKMTIVGGEILFHAEKD